MDVSSLSFLFLFFPTFLLIYLVSARNLKPFIILTASIVFIAWGEKIALLWLSYILISGYVVGLALAVLREKDNHSLNWLWIGIGINLALLLFFKFSVAYGEGAFAWLRLLQTSSTTPVSGLVVPLGLSYVTLQIISYLVDVWRGNTPAEKNFISFSIFLLFFPKLVSGPMTRYASFAHQLEQLAPSFDDIASGFRRLLIGFTKRTLIANQLAPITNAVFNLSTANIEPKFAWLALLAYALQIFFDFSGYTDMAIGLGLMMGVHLPENFNFPYIAQSLGDFWRRWHITLSSWFREYVFYPLERRKYKWTNQQINILIVFLLTGLWHGFKPTFIVWGLLHGIAVAAESLGLGYWLKKAWRPIRHIYTLSIAMMGWVFFRSNNLTFAFEFFRRLSGDVSGLTLIPFSVSSPMPFVESSFILVMAAGIFFSLPVSSVWKLIRVRFVEYRAIFFFMVQIFEDVLLFVLFILGLAMLLNNGFLPNIYAGF